jgi:CRP/FNR family transcriptional regulator
MNKLEILQGTTLFRSAASEVRREMEDCSVRATLPTGAFYIHEGDKAAYLAMVGKGRLRVFKTAENGREITLYHVGAGESCLLNLTCILSDVASPASAVALLPVEAVLIPAANVRRWIADHPPLRAYVFARLSSQVADLMSLVEEVSFSRMDRRLAGFLLDHAPTQGNGRRQLAITHEQIARELGTAREVVSRLLKDLERRGVVELARGCVRISDEKALSAEA